VRRQFDLPGDDIEYLDGRSLTWETLVEEKGRWLLLRPFPVPSGFNHATIEAALRIEPGYPDAQIDMVYCFPALARLDGRGIGSLTTQKIDGREFQRWSRHRTKQNPWQPGVDCIATHLLLVDDWLRREFAKGAA
jgi:hypothetical protein